MIGFYYDDAGRLRESSGRFAKIAPDEICPNGCERYGDWWVAEDCPTHLLVAAPRTDGDTR